MFSETRMIEEGRNVLNRVLPPDWACEDTSDRCIRIQSPDGTQATFQIEAKRRVPLGMIPNIQALFKRNFGNVPLVIAHWLSPLSRAELTRVGINYLDLTGNVDLRLARPGLYVCTQGADHDPEPLSSTLASLKGAGAARAVRALADFFPPYGVRQLAALSDASAPVLSRVLMLLEREGLVERNQGAVVSVAWANMLRRWTEDYNFVKTHRAVPCLEPRGIPALVQKLIGWSEPWAASGTLGVPLGMTVAPLQLATLYVKAPEQAIRSFGLKTVVAGANVLLVEPVDNGVFARSLRGSDGIVRCAPSQVFADLLTGPGRGSSEAESLLAWMEIHETLWRKSP